MNNFTIKTMCWSHISTPMDSAIYILAAKNQQ